MKPAQLAKRVGVSRGAVSLWLSGQTSNLKDTNIAKVADVLNVSVHWLVNGTPQRKHARQERPPPALAGEEIDPLEIMDKRRQAMGLNWSQFAELLGESRQNVRAWRTRGAIPGSKLAKVARCIGVSVDEMLRDRGAEAPAIDYEATTPRDLVDAILRLSPEMRAHVTAIVKELSKPRMPNKQE